MATYRLKADSILTVEKKLDDLWMQLRTNKGLIEDLAAAGYSPSDIPPGQRKNLIAIKAKRQGLFESGTDIAVTLAPYVALAPVAKRVLTDIWGRIILPRLVNYLGPAPKSRSKTKRHIAGKLPRRKTQLHKKRR